MTKFLNHTRIKTVVGENGNYGKWEILGRITYYRENYRDANTYVASSVKF